MSRLPIFLIYLIYVMRLLFCLPVLPLIYWLGIRTKKNIPDLPEAFRNIEGVSGNYPNKKHILLIGESSISGVGIEDHSDGIPGEIGRELERYQQQSVSWQVVAKSGFRASEVIEKLIPVLPDQTTDLLIVGLGGNDTFKSTPPWIWRKNMKIIVRELQNRFSETNILLCAMPPVADFPAFPSILKSFMGGQTNILRYTIMDFPQLYDKVFYLSEKVRMTDWMKKQNATNMSEFFSDGVHPSALTYQLIGRAIAEKIMEKDLTGKGLRSDKASARKHFE